MAISRNELKKSPSAIRIFKKYLPGLTQSGPHNWKAHCPFHDGDNQASLDVDNKAGLWLFKCFGCNKSGSAIDLILAFEKCSLDKAFEILESVCEKPAVMDVFRPVNKTPALMFSFQQIAVYEKGLENSISARDWLLNERGITYETAKEFHLGFIQDLGKLCPRDKQNIQAKGWLVIPYIQGNQVIMLKFRSIVEKSFVRMAGMQTCLFGLQMVDPFEDVYVCEGAFDAMVLKQAGFRTVALDSAQVKLTDAEVKLLQSGDRVILSGDSDATGLDSMNRLWKTLKTNTFLLQWPSGMKDATDVLVKLCGKNLAKFKALVTDLTQKASIKPLPGVQSLVEALESGNCTITANYPGRFKFPWKHVDEMAMLIPGTVLVVSSTLPKMGKSMFVMNATLNTAIKNGDVVLNYQAELTPEEFINAIAAHTTHQKRLEISETDYKNAANKLRGVKYYVGRDENLKNVFQVLDSMEDAIKTLGVNIAVLDHLHHLTVGMDNEVSAQAEAMVRIKNIARDNNVVFIVICQPRKLEGKRRGKSMDFDDFKGTQAIHAACDAAMILHRESVRNENDETKDHFQAETSIKCSARLHGPGGSFAKLIYDGATASFFEMTSENPENYGIIK